MFLTTEELKKLKSYFESKRTVKSVILYGSYASGYAAKKSDIDLLVELDYTLSEFADDFIAMKRDLEKSLSKPISIISAAAVSPQIKPFIDAHPSIIIYLRNDILAAALDVERDWPSYNKHIYRDKARLIIINEAIKKLRSLGGTADTVADVDAEDKLFSAALHELHVITSVANLLQEETLQTIFEESDNKKEEKEKITSLRQFSGDYYGSDNKVLWKLIESRLYPLQQKIQHAILNWDVNLKAGLVNYFIKLLAASREMSNRNSDQFTNENDLFFDINAINLSILSTVNRLDITQINARKITEGEQNIQFATRYRSKWKELKSILCPFFPFC